MTVKIGIEIELTSRIGTTTNTVLLGIGWKKKYDGSLSHRTNMEQNEFISNPITININDVPGTVTRVCNDYKKILDSLESKFCNDTMGIHVHFSGLKKGTVYYSRGFFYQLREKYQEICTNDVERKRLNSYYCNWTNYRDNQEKNATSSDRYTAINIGPAFAKHGTIEFRFLPSTDKISKLKKYLTFLFTEIKRIENENVPDIDVNINDVRLELEEIEISRMC